MPLGLICQTKKKFSPGPDIIIYCLTHNLNLDAHVKNQRAPVIVIPANAGIQENQPFMDSRVRESDGFGDFLRGQQSHSKMFSIKVRIKQMMLKIETTKTNLARLRFSADPYDLSYKYTLSLIHTALNSTLPIPTVFDRFSVAFPMETT